MKPLYVGLLVFSVTVAIGVSVLLTQAPQQRVALPPVSPSVSPAPVVASVPVTPIRRQKPTNTVFTKRTRTVHARTAASPQPLVMPFPTTADGQAGGIFSGADPVDPRIYHFAE
jgi:hypothetical protein